MRTVYRYASVFFTLLCGTFYTLSAYGVPSSRYAGTAENNRKHLGLEWQPMKGLYGYYNNARFRDALLAGTFYQLDPLAEKYQILQLFCTLKN